MPFFHDILDVKRSTVLDECRAFKKDFYLAGGTALALRIGHRDSFDFDFFHAGAFDTARLFARVKKAFSRRTIRKIQEEENTLTVLVDGVKIYSDDGSSALLIPDKERPLFHINAEAPTHEAAEDLASAYEKKVMGWRDEP